MVLLDLLRNILARHHLLAVDWISISSTRKQGDNLAPLGNVLAMSVIGCLEALYSSQVFNVAWYLSHSIVLRISLRKSSSLLPACHASL